MRAPHFMTRRKALAAAAGLAALTPALARAQSYPDRPLRLIVPFSPGGTVDLVGRLVAGRLPQTIGQGVVVENRGGASGSIGSIAAARAAPDGYTFMVGSTTTISIFPQIDPNAGYDPARDFIGLTQAAYVPHVLLINPRIPATNIPELVAFVHAQGKPLAMGDGGIGTPHYLAGELFGQAAGIEILHVSYRGGGEVLNDLLGGTVQCASVELSVAAPHMASGQLRAVGLANLERASNFPDLPTIAEQGFPGFTITSWFGFFVPARTPAPITAKLGADIITSLRDPEVMDRLTRVGATVVASTPAEFEEHLSRERAKWGGAIHSAGVTLSAR